MLAFTVRIKKEIPIVESSAELLPTPGEVCLPLCALMSHLTQHLASLFKLQRLTITPHPQVPTTIETSKKDQDH